MTDEKAALRAHCLALAKALPPAHNTAAGEAVWQILRADAAYAAAQTVFCYVGTPMEIDTMPLLRGILADGKALCAPFCHARGRMTAKRVEQLADLTPDRFGILSPAAGAPDVPPAEIDLALVPCLAADKTGARLGYGGGYYDRYLPLLRASAATVCLCRTALLMQKIPVEAHDVRIARVLTERGFL